MLCNFEGDDIGDVSCEMSEGLTGCFILSRASVHAQGNDYSENQAVVVVRMHLRIITRMHRHLY